MYVYESMAPNAQCNGYLSVNDNFVFHLNSTVSLVPKVVCAVLHLQQAVLIVAFQASWFATPVHVRCKSANLQICSATDKEQPA
jgi:hypothetical protein